MSTEPASDDTFKLSGGTLSVEVKYKAKASYPLQASPSVEGTVGKEIVAPIYSDAQHRTWQTLLSRQNDLIVSGRYLCSEYHEGLKKLNFNSQCVSNLAEVNAVLKAATGWQVVRVEGLVSPENFFKLLSQKLFPCTDFIRHHDEIDYTPAPDTFHDQVGHLPMIMHKRFADFFELFGKAGTRVRNKEELEWFNRIYWFTVEFGLINPTVDTNYYDVEKSLIYGAGIASSCGEIVYCLSNQVLKRPFDFNIVTNTAFDIHYMQTQLFEIESFDKLETGFRAWAMEHGFLDT